MANKAEQSDAMYCLGCFYPLSQLESSQCPECGRGFDPDDSTSYSVYSKPMLLPRWECLLAGVLLVWLVYLSKDWRGMEWMWGRVLRVSWVYPPCDPNHGPYLAAWSRVREVAPVFPLLVVIPGLLISSIRHSRRQKSTLAISLFVFVIYALWPGTWIAFGRLPGAVETMYRLSALY